MAPRMPHRVADRLPEHGDRVIGERCRHHTQRSRVLAEIGDDRTRFADAGGLKAYPGSARITVAGGKSEIVRHRKVKNQRQRLAAAGYVWILGTLRNPVIKAHYDRRRTAGEGHPAAMRNLFNGFLGCLYHCLRTGQTFDPNKAFSNHVTGPENAVAA